MGRPRAVVVLTGSELVRGDKADANGAFLARELTRLGLEPSRKAGTRRAALIALQSMDPPSPGDALSLVGRRTALARCTQALCR